MKFKEKRPLMRVIIWCFLMISVFWMVDVALLKTMDAYQVNPEIILIPFIGMVVVAILCIVAIYHETKVSENLRKILSTDHLTGASNWGQFQEDCEGYLKKSNQMKYAMVTFDSDKFKAINDLYSHEVGNEILTAIAKSLSAFIREEETFSRTATDNFNILLKCDGPDELILRIEDLIEEIKNNAHAYAINISVGICMIKDNTLDINILSDRANMARRSIKNNCEKQYTFYTESMRHTMLKEKIMENRMSAALGNHEFEMYLQPKHLFSDDRIIGAEALVRWNCPGVGIIPPNDFIPLFEKNGFVKQIDTYMFEEACKLLEKWKNETNSFSHMAISVNFSRLHLNNLALSKELLEITERYHIDPKLIEIELTENTIFNNENQMIIIMNDLKESGFRISIDDFGRAYSSLNTLKNLPADILKLDKEFFEETSATNLRGKKIIMCILKMARELDLITVAEGVETLEQVDFLKEMGCDIAQGFYYARPMPVADFEAFITNKLQIV